MNRPAINSRIYLMGDPNQVTVTGHTEHGFTYEYDYPIPFGRASWGQYLTGGENFCDVYPEVKTWGYSPIDIAITFHST